MEVLGWLGEMSIQCSKICQRLFWVLIIFILYQVPPIFTCNKFLIFKNMNGFYNGKQLKGIDCDLI